MLHATIILLMYTHVHTCISIIIYAKIGMKCICTNCLRNYVCKASYINEVATYGT